MRQSVANEFIGQEIDYSEQKLTTVRMLTIDGLNLVRLDLIKIDVERMELEVLAGAKGTLQRFLPIIIVEGLKAPQDELTGACVVRLRVVRARAERDHTRSSTHTGTWSDPCGQSRASFSTICRSSLPAKSGVTHTWSNRRPRSEARQSRLRYDHHV